MTLKSSWKRVSPEAKARAKAHNDAKRRRRYWYMRNVLKAEPWICREGQHSNLAMKSFFPDHEFPPEFDNHKSGPKSCKTTADHLQTKGFV